MNLFYINHQSSFQQHLLETEMLSISPIFTQLASFTRNAASDEGKLNIIYKIWFM